MNHKVRLSLALSGARDTIPLVIAAMPFGLVFGALAISSGFSATFTMAMSIFVFAGASQFIAISLLASAAAFPIVLITVFIVNLRHLLYSASLMNDMHTLAGWAKPILSFWMTDETFAVVTNRRLKYPKSPGLFWYYLGSALFMYLNWQLFTWVGIHAGERIPDINKWGLDVAMVVAFIGIVTPLLKTKSHWACALTAAVSAGLTIHWPYQLGFLFSCALAIIVGVTINSKTRTEVQHV
ncbi:AzlC family ABC transporter permease [Gynuella sp.]|uniref:AzlC family ABC transporter permease n=1 Tax=Gynuella sp. TaxID=2969146 RepID=UPI003D105FC5